MKTFLGVLMAVGAIAQQVNLSGSISGTDNFKYFSTALGTPSTPTITNIGAAGSTTTSYRVVQYNGLGQSLQSALGTTTTGNSDLDGTNYNRIAPGACTGSGIGFWVFRVTTAQYPHSTGYIGNAACGGVLNDTALDSDNEYAGPAMQPLNVDTSAGMKVAGNLAVGSLSAVSSSAGPDAPLYIPSLVQTGVYGTQFTTAILNKIRQIGDVPRPAIVVTDDSKLRGSTMLFWDAGSALGPGLTFLHSTGDSFTSPGAWTGDGIASITTAGWNTTYNKPVMATYIEMGGSGGGTWNTATYPYGRIQMSVANGDNFATYPGVTIYATNSGYYTGTFLALTNGFKYTQFNTGYADTIVGVGQNSEFVEGKWSSNVYSFGPVALGSGTVRAMKLTGSALVLDSAAQTPASSGAACTANQFAFDASYVYVCTATNTWKRAAISTW